MKKVKIRSPSGNAMLRRRRERVAAAKCANCKSPLHGLQRKTQSGFKKLSLSERRPERPYGGCLCSNCSRDIFRERARGV